MLDPKIHAFLTAQGYTVVRPLTKTRGNMVVLIERDLIKHLLNDTCFPFG